MPQPEKLTADIQLPTETRMDPRLNTSWYRDARRRAAEKPVTGGQRTGGIRTAVSKARDNFRTFVKGR